jgi:hypothetical protein
MGRGTDKSEIILLYDWTKLQPKDLRKFLLDRGQHYSEGSLNKLHQRYKDKSMVAKTIMKTPIQAK